MAGKALLEECLDLRLRGSWPPRERLRGLEARRDRYSQVLALSDFIRDVLKKAVPYITEAHLQSISIEANQLYRDITGNPMVSLRWDPGYEIILEEEGHERAFAAFRAASRWPPPWP